MSKVTIDANTPMGNLVARAINKIMTANADLKRAQGVSAMIGGDGSLLVGGIFGGGTGQGADYQYALNVLSGALDSFVGSNSGSLETLDNGDVPAL